MSSTLEDRELIRDLRTEWTSAVEQVVGPIRTKVDALALRSSKMPGATEHASLAPRTSLAKQLNDNDGFQTWLRSNKTAFSGYAAELKLPSSRKTIMGLAPTESIPRIWGPPTPPTRLRDFLPAITATSGVIEYVQETSYAPGAGIVPEGALKPAMNASFVMVTVKISTIASTIKMSVQSFSDLPMLEQWLDMRLRSDVLLREENVFINGDVANNVEGLLQVAPVFAYVPATGDTGVDVIAHAVGDLLGRGYAVDALVLNSADFTTLQLLKNAVGSYVMLPSVTPPDDAGVWEGAPSLWGLPVVVAPSMPVGKFLVGSFQAGAALFDREVLAVQISFEDSDNFIRNLVTLRAELRSALTLPLPSAFWQGPLPASSVTRQEPLHAATHATGTKK